MYGHPDAVQHSVWMAIHEGLKTVSRKMTKNLAVRRKNKRILTVSRKKKMLTVKKPNHKIRYRDLSLSLMRYAFLYNNQINARFLIGQSAISYCAGKPTEKSRVF